jgi:hypothetical protein
VKIVEVGCKAQSLNCAVDVFFDMFGRVGYTSLLEDGKSTLGSDEDLVADFMLADEVTEELFVDTCSVNDLLSSRSDTRRHME